jgi:pyruvate carboxylase
MLVRGSNAVGYTSYPDNVVAEFIRLAAKNGMDIFRIFDCFNDVESMKISIDAVRAAGKVAEVCLCYAGNLLTSPIYHVEYYKDVAKKAVEAGWSQPFVPSLRLLSTIGAHFIGIKDMAGLLRPLEVAPLLTAVREVIPHDMPIHFHTHATSSGSLATLMEIARHGCDIVDVCTASMADGTSQPSMNTFVAMLEGGPRETGEPHSLLTILGVAELIPRRDQLSHPGALRHLLVQCAGHVQSFRIRLFFESHSCRALTECRVGMLSGSARVYEHQIPGGQYSNLIVQCHAMGLWHRWEEVLDAYRDSNRVLGDIIKVGTPPHLVLSLFMFPCPVLP